MDVELALRPFLTGGAKSGQTVGGIAKADLFNAATVLPGNTSQLKRVPSPSPSRGKAAPARVREEPSAFALPASAVSARRGRKTKGKKAPPARKMFWAACVAAGVLAKVLISAVVVTLKMPGGGTVVVEIDQKDAQVFVDG